MYRKYKIFWFAISFVFLWNSGFIAATYGLSYTGTFTFLLYRYAILTSLLFFYLQFRGQFYWLGWRYAWHQMLIGVLAHGVWLTCVFIALDYGVPPGIVALIVALQPLATGAFSGVMVGEKTHWYHWIGLITGFFGVALPVLSRIDLHDPFQLLSWFIPLGSVVAITFASLLQRKISLKKNYPDTTKALSLFYQSLATSLAVLVPAVFIERLSAQWNPVFISSLLWLIIVVSFGAYTLMWYLIDQINATKVASLFYPGPPVTMLMAWIFFGDKVEFIDLVGLVIVFTGVLLTYLRYPASLNR